MEDEDAVYADDMAIFCYDTGLKKYLEYSVGDTVKDFNNTFTVEGFVENFMKETWDEKKYFWGWKMEEKEFWNPKTNETEKKLVRVEQEVVLKEKEDGSQGYTNSHEILRIVISKPFIDLRKDDVSSSVIDILKVEEFFKCNLSFAKFCNNRKIPNKHNGKWGYTNVKKAKEDKKVKKVEEDKKAKKRKKKSKSHFVDYDFLLKEFCNLFPEEQREKLSLSHRLVRLILVSYAIYKCHHNKDVRFAE